MRRQRCENSAIQHGSPQYHQFVSSAEFKSRYSPSEAQIEFDNATSHASVASICLSAYQAAGCPALTVEEALAILTSTKRWGPPFGLLVTFG